VFAMTLTGSVVELFQPQSAIRWPVVICLSVGGMLGALLGQRVARRVDADFLTWVFALALCTAGVRVLTTSAEPAIAAASASSDWELARSLAIAAIGFAGGFVAPLLGVGGGLIVVPALFLGVPSMTYLAARACSTAMSAVNSAQLTWLNLRENRVQRALVAPFAGVAALGAAIGILLVHRPGWAEAARLLMGGLLLAIGAKFAWIGWRTARAR